MPVAAVIIIIIIIKQLLCVSTCALRGTLSYAERYFDHPVFLQTEKLRHREVKSLARDTQLASTESGI